MNEAFAAPQEVRRLQQRSLIVGIVALVLLAAGGFYSRAAFFRAYLVAYYFWVGLPIGCLALFMIHNLTGGGWGFAVRRVLEAATRTLPLMIVLFIPILLGMHDLYAWMRPPSAELSEAIEHKAPYLNLTFFVARAIFYFAVWFTMIHFLNKWSRAQDRTFDPTLLDRMQNLSGPGLVIIGLTGTFASFDWLMSLEPEWSSTIFGMIQVVGWVLSSLAFAITAGMLLARREPMEGVVTAGNFHDLGKLLLAFVMLWAYVSFSQFLITWAGNLPEEIQFYLPRLRYGFQYVALGIVLLHFALPFALLLSRDLKRHARQLAGVALVVIIMRFVDIYWLVAPSARFLTSEVWHIHPIDVLLNIIAPIGMGGLWLAWFCWELGKRPLLPLRDPRLAETLAHASHEH